MKKVKAPPLWVFIAGILLLTILGGFAGFLFGLIVAVVLLKFVLISPYNEMTLQQLGPHIAEQFNKLISKIKSALITEEGGKAGEKMTAEQNNNQTAAPRTPVSAAPDNQPTPTRPPVSASPKPVSSGPTIGSFDSPAVCTFGLVIAVTCYLVAAILFVMALAMMSEGRGWGFLFGGGQTLIGSLVLAVAGVLVHLLTTIADKTSETAHYVRASYLNTLKK